MVGLLALSNIGGLLDYIKVGLFDYFNECQLARIKAGKSANIKIGYFIYNL